jgi:hypothetical protein
MASASSESSESSAELIDFINFMDCYVGIGTDTPTSPLHVVGYPVCINNADALLSGLTAGAHYRLGGDPDILCVVH